MSLMEDEQLIVRWLTEYGPLTKGMLRTLLHYKTSTTVGRILASLRRRKYITEIEDGRYYATDKFSKVDSRMHEALWILFQFTEHIEPNAHRTAEAPAQIFFLKEKTGYEIVVLHEEEDHLVTLLRPQPKTKYIFVIPNLEFAEKLRLPDVPCLFATIEHGENEMPQISFYSD